MSIKSVDCVLSERQIEVIGRRLSSKRLRPANREIIPIWPSFYREIVEIRDLFLDAARDPEFYFKRDRFVVEHFVEEHSLYCNMYAEMCIAGRSVPEAGPLEAVKRFIQVIGNCLFKAGQDIRGLAVKKDLWESFKVEKEEMFQAALARRREQALFVVDRALDQVLIGATSATPVDAWLWVAEAAKRVRNDFGTYNPLPDKRVSIEKDLLREYLRRLDVIVADRPDNVSEDEAKRAAMAIGVFIRRTKLWRKSANA